MKADVVYLNCTQMLIDPWWDNTTQFQEAIPPVECIYEACSNGGEFILFGLVSGLLFGVVIASAYNMLKKKEVEPCK